MTTTPPSLEALLGDPSEFFVRQAGRLRGLGIDAAGWPVSHLAVRTATTAEYVELRDALERHCTANVENVWNGRRISKLLLSEPLPLADGAEVSLIELIPPEHQAVYRMGLEHVGFVVGSALEEFGRRHRDVLTGRQDQGPHCQPFFVTFDDHTNVKFYRYGLQQVVELEGRTFDGFLHAPDPVP